MPAGNGVNCPKCPEKLSGKCLGNDLSCLCYRCPRNLSQCLCVRYFRETESVLNYDEEY